MFRVASSARCWCQAVGCLGPRLPLRLPLLRASGQLRLVAGAMGSVVPYAAAAVRSPLFIPFHWPAFSVCWCHEIGCTVRGRRCCRGFSVGPLLVASSAVRGCRADRFYRPRRPLGFLVVRVIGVVVAVFVRMADGWWLLLSAVMAVSCVVGLLGGNGSCWVLVVMIILGGVADLQWGPCRSVVWDTDDKPPQWGPCRCVVWDTDDQPSWNGRSAMGFLQIRRLGHR